jgi:hypothetical protein
MSDAKALMPLVLAGAALEVLTGGLGFALGGLMAGVAALVGASIASAAQVAAVVLLRPAMQAENKAFQQRWALGMAVRFGSFLVIAALILTVKDVLPPAWLAAGYLSTLLVLLFMETRFLR